MVIGTRPPAWVVEGFGDFARRLPRYLELELVEIPAANRKLADLKRIKRDEGRRMLERVPADSRVVALTESGKGMTTRALAASIDNWMQEGRKTVMLIGGADGLSEDCLQRADMHWSLSGLTFPHALVRVIVAEQIYRAWTILSNHPYHRE